VRQLPGLTATSWYHGAHSHVVHCKAHTRSSLQDST
jgi:hypothetical protein